MSNPVRNAVSSVIGRVFSRPQWSALPAPENTIESINNVVVALKERVLVQSRERGDIRDSFTTVQDMINVGVIDASGKTLASRVKILEATTILQSLQFRDGEVASGTTVLPIDDTIPQITEGDEFLTLTMTPKKASSVLQIDVIVNLGHSVPLDPIGAALFRDSGADALVAHLASFSISNTQSQPVPITFRMPANAAVPTTFSVRAGSPAGTTTFNGDSAGTRDFGGVCFSSITVTEFAGVE